MFMVLKSCIESWWRLSSVGDPEVSLGNRIYKNFIFKNRKGQEDIPKYKQRKDTRSEKQNKIGLHELNKTRPMNHNTSQDIRCIISCPTNMHERSRNLITENVDALSDGIDELPRGFTDILEPINHIRTI